MPFSALKLHPSLLRAVRELGFAKPTPIQADAIPPALAGRDVLACASTGSGKTAAFLLPLLHQLIEKPRGATRALVLTPTRELAAQILEDLNDLAAHTRVRGAAMVTPDGLVITSSLPATVPAEPLAALGAALGRELELGSTRLDRGGFRMAHFVAEGGMLFVAGSPLGFLLLVGDRDADAAGVRRGLGETLARLA